jgi:S1-C subfamily serine protease
MSILVTGSAGHLGEALVRSLRAQGRSAIGSIGIGFAIPSNMASNVMQQLEHGGKVRRGKLGAGIQAVTPELAKSLGIVGTQGVLVNSVEAGGPAEAAGIRAGDVITAVNGHGVQDGC